MHELVSLSPFEEVHGVPGPRHITGSFPSPGEYTTLVGVAVVVIRMTASPATM